MHLLKTTLVCTSYKKLIFEYLTVSLMVHPVPMSNSLSTSWSIQDTNPSNEDRSNSYSINCTHNNITVHPSHTTDNHSFNLLFPKLVARM